MERSGVDPIPELFVRELWSVKTRRGVQGTELITTKYGKVYNGITDGETCRQTESEPTNLPEVLGTLLVV